MENLQSAFYAFTNVVPALAQLGICGYYFAKTRSTDGLLMVVASVMHFIASTGAYVAIPILMQTGSLDTSRLGTFYAATGGLGLIGTLVFLTGFFMLIRKVLSKPDPQF